MHKNANVILVLVGAVASMSLGAAGAMAQQVAPAVAVVGPVTPESMAQLSRHADDVVALLNGQKQPEEMFSAYFLSQMPAEKVNQLTTALRTKFGQAVSVEELKPNSSGGGSFVINLESKQLEFDIGVEADSPRLIRTMAAKPKA